MLLKFWKQTDRTHKNLNKTKVHWKNVCIKQVCKKNKNKNKTSDSVFSSLTWLLKLTSKFLNMAFQTQA